MLHGFRPSICFRLFHGRSSSAKDEQLIKASFSIPLKLLHFFVVRVKVELQEAESLAVRRSAADDLLGAGGPFADDGLDGHAHTRGLQEAPPEGSRRRRFVINIEENGLALWARIEKKHNK